MIQGVRVSRHRLNVAHRVAVAQFPDVVAAEHGGVDILVNNAGVAVGGTFEQVSEEDFEWLFEINFWGVVHMTRAFLPMLHSSDDARIVNLSSVYGIVAPPEQTAYSASKFAVRGFSEALRHELEGSSIGVSVVHPGGVATSIAEKARVPAGTSEEEIARRHARYRKLLRLPPEIAGETIVRGIEQRQSRILIGSDAKVISLIARLFPVTYWKLLARRVGA
jgi:NAD(P)-dependent dehydrogenase (short-subunit alcohol dehydrogenase family)